MMFWRCVRVYSPGIVVIVAALVELLTGDSPVFFVSRGVVFGISLLLSVREQLWIFREQRRKRKE